MKEKRYFCDWVIKPTKRQKIVIIGFLIIATLILSGTFYNIDSNREEVSEYSEEAYEYLEEIADGVIWRNVINISVIPDNVNDYEITQKNGVLTFKCSIDHYAGKKLDPSASITVTENSGVVKKERNISSKEEYTKSQRSNRIKTYLADVCVVILLWCIVFAMAEFLVFILYITSRISKYIDTKKRPS